MLSVDQIIYTKELENVERLNNVCFIKIHSKHSSNTLVSLLRIFMKHTLLKDD